ncbi:MAG: T9SS type A sorting domain-containing protein [Candidatus Zixiibacteriota bacterium]|nr:MAG: T9SS type A sorting domain-containing protein [candidate division Zixibacteria bacterium]
MRSLIEVIIVTFIWGIAVLVNPVVAEDIVYSENFDSGMGAWSGQWGIATVHYHSAPNSMADTPVGNYPPSSSITVQLTTDIDLSSYLGARVEFWTKYELEIGFDYVYMYVSSNGGVSWNNFHTFNGQGVDWYNFIADLGGYVGGTVRFKLTLVTDPGYETDGMYIDDFFVYGLTEDNSPPLIMHEGPTVFTSVPEEYTVIATITDISGVNDAWVTYSVDGGPDLTAAIDSTVGNDYYFTILAAEAGAHVNYTIGAEDNVGNSGTSAEEHYVSGTVIYYDDGEPEFIYEFQPNDKIAVRFTPSATCMLVSGLYSLYTDINRPIDTVDVNVWDNGTNNNPGQSLITPFAVYPWATLEDPEAVTYVDFRGMGLVFDSDFHIGYTYRTQWPVILGDDPAIANRSNYYTLGQWMPASADFLIRAVVDYNLVGVEDDNNQLPLKFDLSQNYPNPFNVKTTLNYSISRPGHVNLTIYNLLGQRVKSLADDHHEPGEYSMVWDTSSLSSGVYFAVLRGEDTQKQIKMLLLK